MLSESQELDPELKVRRLESEIIRLKAQLAATRPSSQPAAEIPPGSLDAPAGDALGYLVSPSPTAAPLVGDGAWSLSGLRTGLSSLSAAAVDVASATATVAKQYAAADQQDGGLTPPPDENTTPPTFEVTWCRFEELLVDGQIRQCLCVANANYCQVFDVEDPAKQRQLLQLRIRGITCMSACGGSASSEGSGTRGLGIDAATLAISATHEGVSSLCFYSLSQGDFIHVAETQLAEIQRATEANLAGAHVGAGAAVGMQMDAAAAGFDNVPLPSPRQRLQLTFSRPVCSSMHCCAQNSHGDWWIVVNLEGGTIVYDRRSLLPACPLRHVALLPPPRPSAPARSAVAVAKSRGWLAYATVVDTPTACQASDSVPLPEAGGDAESVEGADEIAAVVGLTEGLTAMTVTATQLYNQVNTAVVYGFGGSQDAIDGSAGGSAAGGVALGMVTVEELSPAGLTGVASPCHFAAHASSAISTLHFDENGQLLVTASITGKTLKVFSMSPSASLWSDDDDRRGSCEGDVLRPRLLYRLVRGLVIDAAICSVSFSVDRRWLALSSSHGTTHIFAINGCGGAVDAITHGYGGSSSVAAIEARAAEPPAGDADSSEGRPSVQTYYVTEQRAVAMVKRSWLPTAQMVAQATSGASEQFTAYTIVCSAHDGGSWSVQKRYSELAALKDAIEVQPRNAEALKTLEFPAKTWSSWGKMDEAVIKERKDGLQLWLNHVIQRCPNDKRVARFLRPESADDWEDGSGGAQRQWMEGEWPIRVEFIGVQTKSEWSAPMAAQWLTRGGGGVIAGAGGGLRHSVGSMYVFATGELSLHHVMLDLKVDIAAGGSAQLKLLKPS